ncbi:hypothetical protein EJ06DRAFT_525575 [Trichodelitschia bisporula]|uniref:Uncharacterized protein n=1 Tax=Trichodelitschia bisporula TaxID=703511 RepID=A0A6G1IAC4_9PEZI|nr:hypothetical protein EJ06DRAFT_525575 [Trichodelitschia bisporula]
MFTPVETALGALLLHQATTTLLFNNGSILGVSGFLRKLLGNRTFDAPGLFLLGMGAAYIPLRIFAPEHLPHYLPGAGATLHSALLALISGALTGWGTKSCNGCTSGHMLSGLSRLSPRSLVATATFFTTAFTTFHLAYPSLETPGCHSGHSSVPCYTPEYPSRRETVALVGLTAGAIGAVRTLPRALAGSVAPEKTTAVITGLTFGLGLLISGMADPAKVQGFFALGLRPFDASRWDPSLSLVILCGILPNLVAIQMSGGLEACKPAYCEGWNFPIAPGWDVDAKFLLGAVVFGISWGLSGVCPGPAVMRSVLQPLWGAEWLLGYWAGGVFLQ